MKIIKRIWVLISSTLLGAVIGFSGQALHIKDIGEINGVIISAIIGILIGMLALIIRIGRYVSERIYYILKILGASIVLFYRGGIKGFIWGILRVILIGVFTQYCINVFSFEEKPLVKALILGGIGGAIIGAYLLSKFEEELE